MRPSDDLRPRTVEAAREREQDHRVKRNVVRVSWVLLAIVAMVIPVMRQADRLRPRSTMPTAAGLQTQAIQLRADVGMNWALAEAITQLRQRQAKSWNRDSVNR